MIREKSPQERAALAFKGAGLGSQSAREAARLLLEGGTPFETAAVLGQRSGEACSATSTTIREAAERWRRANRTEEQRRTTAWGRPISEVARAAGVAPPASFVHTETTVDVNGKPHHEVVEYHPIDADKPASRTTSAWGRPLSESKEP